MTFLDDVMKEAEAYFDCFLHGDIEPEEWEQSEGSFGGELGGEPAVFRWRVNKDSLLPEIGIVDCKGNDYLVVMKRTRCPDVVVHEWQCWDAYGMSGLVDAVCLQRGRIIFP